VREEEEEKTKARNRESERRVGEKGLQPRSQTLYSESQCDHSRSTCDIHVSSSSYENEL
jgi:hypothetical protein